MENHMKYEMGRSPLSGFFAALLFATPAGGQTNIDGLWSGKTSQGEEIAIMVKDGAVTSFSLGMSLKFDTPCATPDDRVAVDRRSGKTQTTYRKPVAIMDGGVILTSSLGKSVKARVIGKAANDAMTGEIELQATGGCSGKEQATWSATKTSLPDQVPPTLSVVNTPAPDQARQRVRSSAKGDGGRLGEASEPCALKGNVVAAVNEMSASVGGTGFPSLSCVDLPNGRREVQMNVVDGGGQRWILGVDLASAEPKTRLRLANDRSALLVVSDGGEPRYGTLGGQPVDSVVGSAINQQLAKLGSGRIETVTVSGGQPTFVVSWKSAATASHGQFVVDSKGTVSSAPRRK